VQGSAFYNYNSLMKNVGGFRDSLRTHLYKYTALVPPMPWKDPTPPYPPGELKVERGTHGAVLLWKSPVAAPDGELPSKYVVYRFKKGSSMQPSDPRNILAVIPAMQTSYSDGTDAGKKGQFVYMISSLDRLQNESTPCFEYRPGVDQPSEPVAAAGKKPDAPAIVFNPKEPISENYSVTFEEAAALYKLALESSKNYWKK
jgi:hypothetical protein